MHNSNLFIGILALFSLSFLLVRGDYQLLLSFMDSSGNLRFNDQISAQSDGGISADYPFTVSELVSDYTDVLDQVGQGVSSITYGSVVYIFYLDDHGLIGFATYDTTQSDPWDWNTVYIPPDVEMTSGVSAAVYNDVIYIFYAASDSTSNGALYVTYGTDLSRESTTSKVTNDVPNTGISFAPGAIVYNGLLYIFHQGIRNNNQLWFTTYDGTSWSSDQIVYGTSVGGGVTALSDGSHILVFYQGVNSAGQEDGNPWYIKYDGTNWSDEATIVSVWTPLMSGTVPFALDIPGSPYFLLFTTVVEPEYSAHALWFIDRSNVESVAGSPFFGDENHAAQTIGATIIPS